MRAQANVKWTRDAFARAWVATASRNGSVTYVGTDPDPDLALSKLIHACKGDKEVHNTVLRVAFGGKL